MDQAKHFLAFLEEVQQDNLRRLVNDPYNWQIKRFEEGVASELQDVSDILRGKITAYEELLKLPEVLKNNTVTELQRMVEKLEKESGKK